MWSKTSGLNSLTLFSHLENVKNLWYWIKLETLPKGDIPAKMPPLNVKLETLWRHFQEKKRLALFLFWYIYYNSPRNYCTDTEYIWTHPKRNSLINTTSFMSHEDRGFIFVHHTFLTSKLSFKKHFWMNE